MQMTGAWTTSLGVYPDLLKFLKYAENEKKKLTTFLKIEELEIFPLSWFSGKEYLLYVIAV